MHFFHIVNANLCSLLAAPSLIHKIAVSSRKAAEVVFVANTDQYLRYHPSFATRQKCFRHFWAIFLVVVTVPRSRMWPLSLAWPVCGITLRNGTRGRGGEREKRFQQSNIGNSWCAVGQKSVSSEAEKGEFDRACPETKLALVLFFTGDSNRFPFFRFSFFAKPRRGKMRTHLVIIYKYDCICHVFSF